jgi:hypothetical protein
MPRGIARCACNHTWADRCCPDTNSPDHIVGVTPSFKVKTECIPLCVPKSIFTHKTTNSEINSITNVYYNVSLIQNLLQDQEVYTVEQNTTPQAEDRGLARLEEVFIKKFFIF